ncbi:unnamed protein product [Phytophthora fragariaefolia]|uniref:Unnamed protein product n=1 Tax=Phytophthora fragariaefolia TaxID=1490495 RepID=A0A9W6X194_9STRA|nr:unnamed protein product [Phytophthora fragariaefolia]
MRPWSFWLASLGDVPGIFSGDSRTERPPSYSNNLQQARLWTFVDVLVASYWNMKVVFLFVGAQGSAHDASVLGWSRLLARIPTNFNVIADAGYGLSLKVFTPFRSVRYHLKEWAQQENGRPQCAKEIFNLRHAKVRNIIERLIGCLKRRFKVLRVAMEYELETIKGVIFACALVHNFIRACDAEDTADDFEDADGGGEETATHDDRDDAEEFDLEDENNWRCWIANAMWREYKAWCETQY